MGARGPRRPPNASLSGPPSHPGEGAGAARAASLTGRPLGGRGAGGGSTRAARGPWAPESPRLGGRKERVKDPGLALLSPFLGGEAAGREGSELGPGPPQSPPDGRRLGPAGRPFWHSGWGRAPAPRARLGLPRALSHLLPGAPASALFFPPRAHTHARPRSLGSRGGRAPLLAPTCSAEPRAHLAVARPPGGPPALAPAERPRSCGPRPSQPEGSAGPGVGAPAPPRLPPTGARPEPAGPAEAMVGAPGRRGAR